MQMTFRLRFFFGEETFDHEPGNEKDQVSPMFISEHPCRPWDAKQMCADFVR